MSMHISMYNRLTIDYTQPSENMANGFMAMVLRYSKGFGEVPHYSHKDVTVVARLMRSRNNCLEQQSGIPPNQP